MTNETDGVDESGADVAVSTDSPERHEVTEEPAPATPAVSSQALDPEALRRIEEVVERAASRLLEVFDNKLAYDATKQQQIDSLHEEVQQHRAGLVTRAVRPMVQGLIRLHDDIGKLVTSLRGKPVEELSPQRFFSLLEGLQEDIEIVLGQNGVSAFREASPTFDPRRQRVLRKVTTSDSALAGTVAEHIRPGFESGNEIIEKERVAAYDVRPAQPGASPEAVHVVVPPPLPHTAPIVGGQ